jgi:hypothetical protein
MAATLIVLAGTASQVASVQPDVTVTGGDSSYSSDAFCLQSGATFTNFSLGVDGSAVGADAMFSNGAWPWECPPSGCGGGSAAFSTGPAYSGTGRARQENYYITHGNAFFGTVRLYPLALIGSRADNTLGRINQYVLPYIGAGIQTIGDGETASAGFRGREVPTYSVASRTDFVLTYGAKLLLPGRQSRFGLVLEYRGFRNFTDQADIETDTGDVIQNSDLSLNWGAWALGFRFRLGG